MTAIVNSIAAIATATTNEDLSVALAAANDAITAGKRDALRSAYRSVVGGNPKALKAAELRSALIEAAGAACAAAVIAITDAPPVVEPAPKVRKPRGSKYTALLTAIMAEHADASGVAVVTATVLLEAGFAKSTTAYHADWHHSLPCGKACAALGLIGRLSTKGDGENTITITRVAV